MRRFSPYPSNSLLFRLPPDHFLPVRFPLSSCSFLCLRLFSCKVLLCFLSSPDRTLSGGRGYAPPCTAQRGILIQILLVQSNHRGEDYEIHSRNSNRDDPQTR